MKIKASAGSALILAAGLVCFVAAPPAIAAGQESDTTTAKSESTTSDKSVRQGARYLKKRYAHRKHTRAASKSTDTKSAETNNKTEEKVADAGGTTTPAIPDWVANARAQMMPGDAAPDSAKAMSAAMSEKADTVLQDATDKPADAQAAQAAPADSAVVAADQLNDVDRALQEAPSSQTVAMASAKPASDNPAQAANGDSSTLDKTSLIGKVFIAFGALLTMASAARMFMA